MHLLDTSSVTLVLTLPSATTSDYERALLELWLTPNRPFNLRHCNVVSATWLGTPWKTHTCRLLTSTWTDHIPLNPSSETTRHAI